MYIRSIAIAGYILGILFKILHWPGANILLLSGALVTIVSLSVLLVKKPGPWTLRIERPVWLMGSLALALGGTVFKAMHWTGANVMLLLGLAACAAWFMVPPPKSQATLR